MPDSDPSPERRRWTRFLRFRLRTLFIAFTAVSIILGLLGVQWYRGLLESWAVRDLRDAGANVVIDEHKSAVRVWLGGPALDDQRLTNLSPALLRLPRLHELDIVAAPITDAGLKSLETLPQIRILYIHQTQATDAGLDALAKALPNSELRREMPDPIASKLASRTIFRSAVIAMACSPDGAWLATGSGNGTLRWWFKDETSATETVDAHVDWLFTAAFSPDGKMLATGGGDNKIKLWDVATRSLLYELLGHTNDVHAVAFAPNGKFLYSAGDDRTVRVWDLASQTQVDELRGHKRPITSLAISPDGRTLATGSRDGTIRLWDIASPRRKLKRVLSGHAADVTAIAFGPDGAHLASAGYDRNTRVWNISSGEGLAILSGHRDWVFAVAFFADGKHIASGAGDGTVRIWDWPSHTTAAVYNGQQNVSRLLFDPSGHTLFSSAADGTVYARNVADGSVVRILGTRFGDRGLVMIRR
jgi:hypothetical protein